MRCLNPKMVSAFIVLASRFFFLLFGLCVATHSFSRYIPPLEKNFSLFNEFSNHTKNPPLPPPSPPPSHHDILSKFPFLPILKKKKTPLTLKAKSVSSDYLFESVNPPHPPPPNVSLFHTEFLGIPTSAHLSTPQLRPTKFPNPNPHTSFSIQFYNNAASQVP